MNKWWRVKRMETKKNISFIFINLFILLIVNFFAGESTPVQIALMCHNSTWNAREDAMFNFKTMVDDAMFKTSNKWERLRKEPTEKQAKMWVFVYLCMIYIYVSVRDAWIRGWVFRNVSRHKCIFSETIIGVIVVCCLSHCFSFGVWLNTLFLLVFVVFLFCFCHCFYCSMPSNT